MWCRLATSIHIGAGEPVDVYDAGFEGVPDCCGKAVRHEALLLRMEVGDLRRFAVVAAG